MRNRSAQLLAVVGGLALIAFYSILMMATEGNSGWAWILLASGIAILIGGAGLLPRRGTS
ncbi:MAG: hypothetical protein ACR2QO_18510 [Acidimicrobiales bacterium]